MPSIPDGQELPVAGLTYPGQNKKQAGGKSLSASPDVHNLEELGKFHFPLMAGIAATGPARASMEARSSIFRGASLSQLAV